MFVLQFQDDDVAEANVKREIEPKSMKINELREELEARGLSAKGNQFGMLIIMYQCQNNPKHLFKGLKPQLQARLQKAIKADAPSGTSATEEAEVDSVELEKDAEEVAVQDDPETTVIDDVEDNGHSNDGIEIDMADIIVIDEYDSTKKERKSRKKVQNSIYGRITEVQIWLSNWLAELCMCTR